jgi:predicted SprT family Zn-dependent metalloprotease
MEAKWGKDDALARILATIAHELTHYFQWINNLKLTPMGRERQANQYAGFILAEYAHTRTHP